MASGSMKDLTKAITLYFAQATPVLPLPDDLTIVLDAYLDRNATRDEQEKDSLNGELAAIYEKHVAGKLPIYAAFFAVLSHLRLGIRGSGRLLRWWNELSEPACEHLSQHLGLAEEMAGFVKDILAYDDVPEGLSDAVEASLDISQGLFGIWLKNAAAADSDLDPDARFVEQHIKTMLIQFGKRRPREFLKLVNKSFLQSEKRIYTASMLTEFIGHHPARLHEIVDTPLFRSLLECLRHDTSSRIISLALTAVTMIMPHIPNRTGKHLPTLLIIYERLLFWDQNCKQTELAPTSDFGNEKAFNEKRPSSGLQWQKLVSRVDSNEDTIPELPRLFTFLYGLYPLNLIAFIREPQKYLQKHDVPEAESFEREPAELQSRSERLFKMHLQHPNQIKMSETSELSDENRWMRSEASDVIGICLGFCVGPVEDLDKDNKRKVSSMMLADPQCLSHLNLPDDPKVNPVELFDQLRTMDDTAVIERMKREILLLKNSLCYERFLKEEHVLYIGRLKQKEINGSRVESNVQSVLSDADYLKTRATEVYAQYTQLKREVEQRGTIAKKHQFHLTAEARILKKELKSSRIENNVLGSELEALKGDNAALRLLIVSTEERRHNSDQRLASSESASSELALLSRENTKLREQVADHEAREQRARVTEQETDEVFGQNELLQRENNQLRQELARISSHTRKMEAQQKQELALLKERTEQNATELENLRIEIDIVTQQIQARTEELDAQMELSERASQECDRLSKQVGAQNEDIESLRAHVRQAEEKTNLLHQELAEKNRDTALPTVRTQLAIKIPARLSATEVLERPNSQKTPQKGFGARSPANISPITGLPVPGLLFPPTYPKLSSGAQDTQRSVSFLSGLQGKKTDSTEHESAKPEKPMKRVYGRGSVGYVRRDE